MVLNMLIQRGGVLAAISVVIVVSSRERQQLSRMKARSHENTNNSTDSPTGASMTSHILSSCCQYMEAGLFPLLWERSLCSKLGNSGRSYARTMGEGSQPVGCTRGNFAVGFERQGVAVSKKMTGACACCEKEGGQGIKFCNKQPFKQMGTSYLSTQIDFIRNFGTACWRG